MGLRSHWYYTLVHNPVNNLKAVKSLLDDFLPFLPPDTALLSLTRVGASTFFLEGQIVAYQGSEVDFPPCFPSCEEKLPIYPGATAHFTFFGVQDFPRHGKEF